MVKLKLALAFALVSLLGIARGDRALGLSTSFFFVDPFMAYP